MIIILLRCILDMGNIDKSVLKNIYQASKIGIESAEYLFGKVLDRDIKSQLNSYVKQYSNIISQTGNIWFCSSSSAQPNR